MLPASFRTLHTQKVSAEFVEITSLAMLLKWLLTIRFRIVEELYDGYTCKVIAYVNTMIFWHAQKNRNFILISMLFLIYLSFWITLKRCLTATFTFILQIFCIELFNRKNKYYFFFRWGIKILFLTFWEYVPTDESFPFQNKIFSSKNRELLLVNNEIKKIYYNL